MNAIFYNRGGTPVHVDKVLFMMPTSTSAAAVSEVRAFFLEAYNNNNYATRHAQDLSPGQGVWFTLHSGRLNPLAVVSGATRIYVIGRAEWTEAGKSSSRDVCLWLQAPDSLKIKPREAIWHTCG